MDSIREQWRQAFEPNQESQIPSLNQLCAVSTSGLLAKGGGVLRSVYWQIYFSHLPLQSTATWPILVQRSRREYDELRRKLLRAPDGSFPPELGLEASSTTSSSGTKGAADARSSQKGHLSRNLGAEGLHRSDSVVKDLKVNNPLSLEESNPWRDHFATLDLRRNIVTDVQRIFPEVPLFQDERVQQSLTNLILVWCLLHPHLGYRQGMHELAGSVWYVRQRDALEKVLVTTQATQDGLDARIQEILDSHYVEHDTYAMFAAIMRNAGSWYEWKDPEPAAEGQLPPPQPILVKCSRIQELLSTIDPALHGHLQSLGVEPQLYVLRWVRLLFTREFLLTEALEIWDGLFAADTTLALVDFIVIAMLLRIRGTILQGEYSDVLQALLRYPTANGATEVSPSIFVRQALRLRDQPRPTTAVDIVMENQKDLGVDVVPAVPGETGDSNVRRSSVVQTVASGRSFGQRTPLARSGPQDRQQQGQHTSLPGGFAAAYLPEGISDLARGLYERSETLGINRALESTMSNVQRTVGAYTSAGTNASTWSRGHVAPQDLSSFPSTSATVGRAGAAGLSRKDAALRSFARSPLPRSESSTTPTSPRASPSNASHAAPAPATPSADNSAINSQFASLQLTNKAMGAAIGEIVNVFERQWVERSDSALQGKSASDTSQPRGVGNEKLEKDSIEALMALCALKHVRDVLLGATADFNPAIMATGETASAASTLPLATPVATVEASRTSTQDVLPTSASVTANSASAANNQFPNTGFARTRPRLPGPQVPEGEEDGKRQSPPAAKPNAESALASAPSKPPAAPVVSNVHQSATRQVPHRAFARMDHSAAPVVQVSQPVLQQLPQHPVRQFTQQSLRHHPASFNPPLQTPHPQHTQSDPLSPTFNNHPRTMHPAEPGSRATVSSPLHDPLGAL